MFGLLTLLALTRALVASQTPPIRQIYTFPNNTFIEDIAVRQNGDLLITSMSVPTLFNLDPTADNPVPYIIHTFPNASGLANIVETAPNIFTLVAAVWDLAATRVVNNSAVIWSIDLRSDARAPIVRQIAAVTNSTSLNGLASVHGGSAGPHLVLAADSALGRITRINLDTGSIDTAFSDPLFEPLGSDPGTNLGINGLLAHKGFLYFTNSAKGIYGRVAINEAGDRIGDTEIISTISFAGNYDDFAIDGSGTTWIATHPNNVVAVQADDGSQTVLTNETLLLNPTSSAFGKGSETQRHTLYVTNGGEFVGNDLVNEGVVAIDLSGET
jgi:hypothetical protein